MACKHQNWEPVESVVDGEHLANVCADCLRRLPLDYDGSVTEIRQLGSWEPVAYLPA